MRFFSLRVRLGRIVILLAVLFPLAFMGLNWLLTPTYRTLHYRMSVAEVKAVMGEPEWVDCGSHGSMTMTYQRDGWFNKGRKHVRLGFSGGELVSTNEKGGPPWKDEM